MNNEIQVTQLPKHKGQDRESDNVYEFIIPEIRVDETGNEYTYNKKETLRESDLNGQIESHENNIESSQREIEKLKGKLAKIEEIKASRINQ